MDKTNPVAQVLSSPTIVAGLRTQMIKCCEQMTDAWGVLGPEERERVTHYCNTAALDFEQTLSERLDNLVNEMIAADHPTWIAEIKKTTINEKTVEQHIVGARGITPAELYQHKGSLLIVLTPARSLDELHRQGDMFDATNGGDPVDVGAGGDDTLPDSADPFSAWIQDFDRAMAEFGVTDDRRVFWRQSVDALRQLMNEGKTAHEVGRNVGVHGTLTRPPSDLTQDSGGE